MREDVEGRYRLPIASEQPVDDRQQWPVPRHRATHVLAEIQREAPIHDDGRQAQPDVPLLDHGTVLRLRGEIPAARRLAEIKRGKIVAIRRDAADAVRFLEQEILDLEARADSYERVLQLADAPLPLAPVPPPLPRFYPAAQDGAVFHDSGEVDGEQAEPAAQYTAATAMDLSDGSQAQAEAAAPTVPERVVGDGWWDRVSAGDTMTELDAMFQGGAL